MNSIETRLSAAQQLLMQFPLLGNSVRLASEVGRREPKVALNRPVESSLRLAADLLSDARKGRIAAAELLRGHLDAPARQIAQGWTRPSKE